MSQAVRVTRFVGGYVAAVLAATVSATAALALFGFVLQGTANVADLPTVMLYSLLYSAVGVAVLGPIGLLALQRFASASLLAYLLTGALLGLAGGALMTAGETMLGVPFLVAGALAGASAALAFVVVFAAASNPS